MMQSMSFRGFQEISRNCLGLFGCPSGMAKLLALLVFVIFSVPASPAETTEPMQWRSGLSEIDSGWLQHDGDDLRWARPDFDDSIWDEVNLDDLGPSKPGSRWFRRHVSLGPVHQNVRLLLAGGEGTYELYLNGNRMPGPGLRSSLAVSLPVERVFKIPDENDEIEIALRTHIPAGYAAWDLPRFITVTLGRPTAIEYERQ